MHSPNRDTSECPDGYQRYVYRINVSLPSKFPQAEHRSPPPEREMGREPDTDMGSGPPGISDEDREKKEGGAANTD